MNNNLKYRMYGFVPYNISKIQQGIQFGHAVVEYAQQHFDTDEYQNWAKNDKTFIVLNGGSTNDNGYGVEMERMGNMNKILNTLSDNNVKYETFNEIDLGDQLTAIVFLVDEKVWNYEDYPTFEQYILIKNNNILNGINNLPLNEQYPHEYSEWAKLIGGKTNVFLKEFLPKYRIA